MLHERTGGNESLVFVIKDYGLEKFQETVHCVRPARKQVVKVGCGC